MKVHALVVLLMLSYVMGYTQDPSFSQYQSAALDMNPGYAGINGCGKAASGYRLQWPGLSESYNTFYISYDHYLHAIRGGLGLLYLNDRSGGGALTTNCIGLVYAAHITLFNDKLVIRPGIDISYIRKKLDWSKLTFGDMMDPRMGFVYPTAEQPNDLVRSNIDISNGIIFYTKHVYGGVAAHHLTQPNEGFIGYSKLPIKFSAQLGATFGELDSARSFSFSPHIVVMKQQDFHMLVAGIAVKYDKYILGLAYRNNDAFIFQAGFQVPLFKVGYSYDYTVSKLSNRTGGSHELAVSFNILYKKEKKISPLSTVAF
jgi:type IX secretion system PorP/SprF family membrane protein